MVGVPDLDESTVGDSLYHSVSVARGKNEAFLGAGEAEGREQYEGGTPDAWPQLGEGEAVQLLAVVPDGFDIGDRVPTSVVPGPNVAGEVTL